MRKIRGIIYRASFNLSNSSVSTYCYQLHYTDGETESEKLRVLTKTPQVRSGGARI